MPTIPDRHGMSFLNNLIIFLILFSFEIDQYSSVSSIRKIADITGDVLIKQKNLRISTDDDYANAKHKSSSWKIFTGPRIERGHARTTIDKKHFPLRHFMNDVSPSWHRKKAFDCSGSINHCLFRIYNHCNSIIPANHDYGDSNKIKNSILLGRIINFKRKKRNPAIVAGSERSKGNITAREGYKHLDGYNPILQNAGHNEVSPKNLSLEQNNAVLDRPEVLNRTNLGTNKGNEPRSNSLKFEPFLFINSTLPFPLTTNNTSATDTYNIGNLRSTLETFSRRADLNATTQPTALDQINYRGISLPSYFDKKESFNETTTISARVFKPAAETTASEAPKINEVLTTLSGINNRKGFNLDSRSNRHRSALEDGIKESGLKGIKRVESEININISEIKPTLDKRSSSTRQKSSITTASYAQQTWTPPNNDGNEASYKGSSNPQDFLITTAFSHQENISKGKLSEGALDRTKIVDDLKQIKQQVVSSASSLQPTREQELSTTKTFEVSDAQTESFTYATTSDVSTMHGARTTLAHISNSTLLHSKEKSTQRLLKSEMFMNDTSENVKVTDDIPWPVKKEAVVEGDIVLGGLMMVHEREDSVTCGPVMPQGGVQALEAMLYSLDVLNLGTEPFLPNITIGAHILDDCDKDTYGLEMAVDFIKGKQIV